MVATAIPQSNTQPRQRPQAPQRAQGPDSTLDPVRRGSRVLDAGDRGLDVAAAQKRLNEQGADLRVDGRFGAQTEQAVRDFQRQQGLQVDGRIGPDTMRALDNPQVAAEPAQAGRVAATPEAQAAARKTAVAADAQARADRETNQPAEPGVNVSTGLQNPSTERAGAVEATTPPTTEAERYDAYQRMVEERGGTWKDQPGDRNVMAFRTDQNYKTAPRGGVYNDKFVMAWKDADGTKHVRDYQGNTDPAGSSAGRFGEDINGDGRRDLGRVPEGHYEYQTGVHYGREQRQPGSLYAKALRPTGTQAAERDTNQDGNFDSRDQMGTSNDMLFHQGGTNTTSSAGCLTLPPQEWQRFWGDVNSSGNPGKIGVTVVNGQDPVTSGQSTSPGNVSGPGATSTAPVNTPTLRRGADGEAVRDVQNRLAAAGYSPGAVDGDFGPNTERAVRRFQSANGLTVDGIVGPQTWSALGAAPAANDNTTADGTATSANFTPNAAAVAAAEASAKGRSLAREVPKHAETYKRASALTGVPASFIGAIHAQESGSGTLRSSTHGPESGYGLDPRHVSTADGNAILQKHGLGTWERGTDTERSRLQSAVIAAEHFKRNAKTAGVTVGPNMSQRDIAVAATAYISGPNSSFTRRAKETGESFMFKPSDSNPHPYHPGGTSVGSGGRIIRVPPGRKTGLLKWDAMLPLIDKYID